MLTKWIINLTVFFILKSHLSALAPIMQVKFAHMWFDVHSKYNAKEKQDFILGSLIHEICFLENISFIEPESFSLKEVWDSDSPFEAGKKFNLYIKNLRQRHLSRNMIAELIQGVSLEHKDFFIKLLEDEIVYDPELCIKASSYLSAISEGEIISGVKVDRLAIWHGVLYKYLNQRPSEALEVFKKDKRITSNLPEDQIAFWKAALIFFSSHKKMKEHVEDLILDLEVSLEMFKLKFLNHP